MKPNLTELERVREKVSSIIREMDCDDRGKPYVYTQPSMVIWTEKWRRWVAELREAIGEG